MKHSPHQESFAINSKLTQSQSVFQKRCKDGQKKRFTSKSEIVDSAPPGTFLLFTFMHVHRENNLCGVVYKEHEGGVWGDEHTSEKQNNWRILFLSPEKLVEKYINLDEKCLRQKCVIIKM